MQEVYVKVPLLNAVGCTYNDGLIALIKNVSLLADCCRVLSYKNEVLPHKSTNVTKNRSKLKSIHVLHFGFQFQFENRPIQTSLPKLSDRKLMYRVSIKYIH